jgi:hypothetical protein
MEHARGFLAHGVWSADKPMNILETQPQTGADAPTDATGSETELDRANRFEPLWQAMNANEAEHVAHELQNAAGDLMLFALNGYNGLADTFANDTGEAVKANRAAIALCRAALDEIEAAAADVVRDQREYHRRELEALDKVLTA